ncbi:DUF805 domain-containing protein [Pseudomonas sp. JDS28PS106]|uniref:DUF805 domain-containing protein n=1 Tax=Pseudomonas sp. JDS28PS106 TaxID=2497235 RepID=UPI002FD5F8F2
MKVRIIWNLYKQSFTLQGRSSRKEFCVFYLFTTLLHISAVALDVLYFGLEFKGEFTPTLLFSFLLTILPLFSVSVRRLHDIGLNGWYLLLHLIPFVGWLITLMILVRSGTEGDNEYGPQPGASAMHLKI